MVSNKLLIIGIPIITVSMIIYLTDDGPNPIVNHRQAYTTFYRQFDLATQLSLSSSSESLVNSGLTIVSNQSDPLTLTIGRKVCPNNVTLIIMIISHPNDFETRDTVRRTWASYCTVGLSYGFLIGGVVNGNNQLIDALTVESSVWQDLIVDPSYLDTYYNLTRKTQSLVKWAANYCSHASALLKADSDMWINVPKLIKLLPTLEIGLHGHLHRGTKPIRSPKSKWFVPVNQFAGKVFPDYLSGTAYLIVNKKIDRFNGSNNSQDKGNSSSTLFNLLYQTSIETKDIWMEDIYLTGLVAARAKAKLFHHWEFNFVKVPFDVCRYRKIISSHQVSNEEKYLYWDLINESANKSCSWLR